MTDFCLSLKPVNISSRTHTSTPIHPSIHTHRDTIAQEFSPEKLLMLILRSSQFEYQVKTIFQGLLDTKVASWETCKKQASDRMNELSDYFSGEKALTRVKKNENLQKWFKAIATRISNLDYGDSTVAGRRIQQVEHLLNLIFLMPFSIWNRTSNSFLFEFTIFSLFSLLLSLLSLPLVATSAGRGEGVPSDRRQHSGEGVSPRRHRVPWSDGAGGQCQGTIPRDARSRGRLLIRVEDCGEFYAAHP